MVNLSDDRLREMIKFFVHKIPSREVFKDTATELFKKIGDDATGTSLKGVLTKKFEDLKWKPEITEADMVELAKRINYGPLYHAIAKRLSPAMRKAEFPQIAGKFEAAGMTGTPGVGTTTSTSNTAPFPVPIGTMAPSKTRGPSYDKKSVKKKKRKKANKKGKL